jgi:uncharacterized protein
MRTTRWILFALLFALLPGCITVTLPNGELQNWAAGQDAIAQQIAREQQPLRKKARDAKVRAPFFWEVSKGGKTSWLLGTVHVGVSSGALPIAIRSHLADARAVAMEVDMEATRKEWAELAEETSGEENEEPPLDRQLTPEAWYVLCYDLKPISPALLRRMSPSAAHAFYIEMRTTFLTAEPDCMDCDIYQDSLRAKKQMIYLEKLSDMLDVILDARWEKDRMTAAQLDKFLTGDPLKRVKEEIASQFELTLSYKSGNITSLEKAMMVEKGFYDTFIKRRNTAWLPKLEKEFSEGGVFVAVGAGHMVGPNGLLKLLKERGYQLKRY